MQKRPHADTLLVEDRHCQQGLQTGYQIADDLKFVRSMCHDTAEERPYRERKGEAKTVCHWGQRKLMMAELDFLTEFHQLADTVVYAGAAPGYHLPYLAELFSELRFVLVDPRPIDKAVETCRAAKQQRLELRRGLFTDEMAKEFSGKGVLFISDIRTSDGEREPNEAEVRVDMERQKAWHLLMEPVASCLKFRLPWSSGTTVYLDGDIRLPVWGPQSTTECRLFVKRGAKLRNYDNGKYESQMFYFNTHQRVARYKHAYLDFYKCCCYDCTAEACTLERYLSLTHDTEAVGVSANTLTLAEMSLRLDKECHRDHQKPRTLFDPNPEPEERKKRIRRRQG